MIIWGSKIREVIELSGNFYCPECDNSASYDLIKAKKYFTLYFIPIFPLDTIDEYIKCKQCSKYFKSAVLQYRPPTEEEKLMHGVLQDLQSGTPIQMVTRKLLNSGCSTETTQAILDRVAGANRKQCVPCGFEFLHSINACSNYGRYLCQIFHRTRIDRIDEFLQN